MSKLTPYQCKYEKSFKGPSSYGGGIVDITPREKLAELINGEWKYSWHWSDTDHNKWLEQVKENLSDEFNSVNKRLLELEQAKIILLSIKPEYKELEKES